MKKTQLILAAIGLIGTNGLNAQAKPRTDKESKVYKPSGQTCTSKDGTTECRVFHFTEDSSLIKRAAIGVQVQTTGTKRDTVGVFIGRVVPDGPAEKAGIVEGDRIVSINGVDLRVAAADVDDSYTAGIASHRLTREMEKLTPGSVVRLQISSGGRIREVQVTSSRASDIRKLSGDHGMVFPRMPMMPSMPQMQIMREMEPFMMLTPGARIAPQTPAPARIPGVPSPAKLPMEFNLEDNAHLEMPVLAPAPVAPARAKLSGQFRRSI